jgi:hypothetical protein
MNAPQNPYGAPGDPWSGQQQAAQQGQNPAYPAQPYPQQGYPQPGYPQQGYPQQGYPGQPAQQPGYGMPAYPGGPVGGYRPDPGPPPARPSTVTAAFWLWIAAAVAAVVSGILVFTSDIWAVALAEAGVGATTTGGVSISTLITTAKTVAVVVMVIFVALYVFFAVKMLLGRNWARVVLTVLAGLAIISGFSARAEVTVGDTVYAAGSSEALRWVQVGLSVIGLILMWLAPSNAYFSAVKARRMYVR